MFGMVASKVKMNANGARTFLEIVKVKVSCSVRRPSFLALLGFSVTKVSLKTIYVGNVADKTQRVSE